MLGARDPARYYLQRQADCPADYYLGRGETPGRWCGSGAAELGLTGPLQEGHGRELTALLAGRHPDDDTELARPVLRTDPDGLLPSAPLVTAVSERAEALGVPVARLVADRQLAERLQQLTQLPARAAAGRSLTPTVAAALATATRLDPVAVWRDADGSDRLTAARAKEGARVDMRRTGLDLTISPPKSVSVLYGLGSKETAGQVRAAHEAAVQQSVTYLERHASHGMRGHQGDGQRTARVPTEGLIAIGFEHRTSRADDPQLHTHLVVVNLLHGQDGKWSAVDSRAMHRHALTAGYLYQAVLRGELTARLGVGWTAPSRGVAEIVGIPPKVRRLFSTRRAQITDALERSGRSGRAAAQQACYATRAAKSGASEVDLHTRWADRLLEEIGISPEQLEATVLHQTTAPELPDLDAIALEVLGPEGVTRQMTSFDRRQMTQAIAVTLPTGLAVTAEQLDTLTDRLLAHALAVPLLTGADPDLGRRYTSADLLETEQRALDMADGNSALRALPADQVEAALAASRLSDEQQNVVRRLTTSSRAVEVITGAAGTGKTSALAEAHRLWAAAGIPVYGASLAAIAARRLETGTGIPSTSLTRLLGRLDRPADPRSPEPTGLPVGSVVVLDEAGMVGTRQLTRLLAKTYGSGALLVLVGDNAQLSEIDAGGLFTALTQRDTYPRLQTNLRQQQGWEQQALGWLRDGQAEVALHGYRAGGRLHIAEPDELARQMAADYVQAREFNITPYDVVALAARRADVDTLNTVIRETLREHRQLGPDLVTLERDGDAPPLQLAAGDVVIGTRNNPGSGMLNGTRATVTGADQHRISLRTDDGQPLTLRTDAAATQLAHAYALTVHKAQGLTVETCLVHADGLDRKSAYVALSRGRDANQIYLPGNTANVDVAIAVMAEQLGDARTHVLALHQQPAAQTRRRDPARQHDNWLHHDPGRDTGRGR